MRGLPALVLLGGCLSPLVSDDVDPPGLILPAGTAVPALEADPALAAQIAEHDGVDGTAPLVPRASFSAGLPAAYWDLGETRDVVAPLFLLHRRAASGELEPLAHPPIVDAIPGDAPYSPYWRVFAVEVTARYAGELLPSVAALGLARERGLVLAPSELGDLALHRPIVAADAQLEPPAPTGSFYFRGRLGRWLDLGATPLAEDGVHVLAQDLYVLSREGGEPLRERDRGVDMTGDGDLDDSNDVLALPASDPTHRALCRVVEVTVAPGTVSIDTTRDQTMAELRAAGDLFIAGVPTAVVLARHDTGRFLDCPQQALP